MPMDQIKQIRLFKMLIAVLIIMVAAQFTFWFGFIHCDKSSTSAPVEKVRLINQQRKVIAPAVMRLIEFVK